MDDESRYEGRTSRHRERLDIRVGVERRRRWGRDEKLRILRESLEPNAVVSEVARRNEISSSLIYTWRRQALAGVIEGFHQVRVVPGMRQSMTVPDAQRAIEGPEASMPLPAIASENAQTAEKESIPEPSRAVIEVTLPGGAVVRVDGAVDAAALRTILGTLVAR